MTRKESGITNLELRVRARLQVVVTGSNIRHSLFVILN